MEYLSRALDLQLPSSFQYHTGCKKLKLVHLSFADDLLLFSASHLDSVHAINDILLHFSEVSGMKVNEEKSSLFVFGTSKENK